MLEVKDLRIHFRNAPEGHDAVKGVSFSLKEGDILGVVGESGSGKTVTAMAISGLLPENAVDCSGSVCFDGLDLLHSPRRSCVTVRAPTLPWCFRSP